MSAEPTAAPSSGRLPEGEAVKENLRQRSLVGRIWHGLFLFSAIFGAFKAVNNVMNEQRAGALVEYAPTQQLFQSPSDPRTEQDISGRFG